MVLEGSFKPSVERDHIMDAVTIHEAVEVNHLPVSVYYLSNINNIVFMACKVLSERDDPRNVGDDVRNMDDMVMVAVTFYLVLAVEQISVGSVTLDAQEDDVEHRFSVKIYSNYNDDL